MKCDVKLQIAVVHCWLMVYVLGLPVDSEPEVRSNIEKRSTKRQRRFSFEPATGFGKRSWTRPSLGESDNIPFDYGPNHSFGKRYSPYIINRKRLSDTGEQLNVGPDTYFTNRRGLSEDEDGDYWRADDEVPVGRDVMNREPILEDDWPEDDNEEPATLSEKYNVLRRKYNHLTKLFQSYLEKDMDEK